ncbi:MAG TPA: dihydroorotase [Acidobacteriaceae bacterium]
MKEMLISGGHIIDPASGIDDMWDVLVRDGRIAAVDLPGAFASVQVEETIDATGCVVAPGLIDIHVHLREPGQTHKETIATGTAAAAAGGFTTVVAMPNTVPVNDSVETLRWMISPDRQPAIRVFAMAAATMGSAGEQQSDFEALAAAGSVGFTDDGKPILDAATMRSALLRAAALGLPVSQHAEDPRLSHGAIMNAGPVAFRLGLRGYPNIAESSIVERDIQLVREIVRAGGPRPHLHVQHVSTAGALKAIREAKAEGLHVTCEAAPHHFTLTDEAIGDYDTNAKMNPPLRAEADRQAVIEALLDGTVDCIATDHAPHASHEKEVEFERAPNGITGLETALGLALRILHRGHGMPVGRVMALMSSQPADVMGLKTRGDLRVGSCADVVVFDAGAEWNFAASASRSKSKNTPFDGAVMLGRVRATVCEGRVVYRPEVGWLVARVELVK